MPDDDRDVGPPSDIATASTWRAMYYREHRARLIMMAVLIAIGLASTVARIVHASDRLKQKANPDGSKLQVREAYRDEQPRPGAWREAPPAAPQAPQARGSRQRRA